MKMSIISLIIGIIMNCVVTMNTEEIEVPRDTSNLEKIALERYYEQEIHIEPILTIQQDEELQLMARIVYGEAGNQDELGQRLVIDCILNRLDEGFANTITDVLYQENQFDAIYRVDEFPVDENIYNMIREEQRNRYNNEVLYFRADHYHEFGEPLLQHGNHYFSR